MGRGRCPRRNPPHVEQAEAHYREPWALADELGMRPLMAHCHLGLGEIYRRTGDRAATEEQLTTAATLYREMDMGFWLGHRGGAVRKTGD